MDDSRFDALTRLIGTTRTRRDAVRSALGASTLGAASLVLLETADGEAKRRRRKRKKKKGNRCLDAGDPCTNSTECCTDTTKRICDVQRNAGNSDRECCGGVGAVCGGKNEDEDDIPPFCCVDHDCNPMTRRCVLVLND